MCKFVCYIYQLKYRQYSIDTSSINYLAFSV